MWARPPASTASGRWSITARSSSAHMPAPEIFLTAVAARTKQMRVGHAVVLTHPLFNHPVRVAERAAVLDNLSDGRLEIGFGRSTLREWDVFHIDGESTRSILREVLEIMPRMWTEDEFSYESEHVKIAPITVVPSGAPGAPTRQCGSPVAAPSRSSSPDAVASATSGSRCSSHCRPWLRACAPTARRSAINSRSGRRSTTAAARSPTSTAQRPRTRRSTMAGPRRRRGT